jgi:rhamnose utilization protein RhaD (predicted bifunctional aldolase and dehydrogenase)/NAD(P)-dependent dehydrogenase (short-subunit alcohol dehydrogenase family)
VFFALTNKQNSVMEWALNSLTPTTIMQSLWNDSNFNSISTSDILAQRVYSSQILGMHSDLVLHGGGNTSVKAQVKDFFGELTDLIYVKGSGWDLATIRPEGFAPVKIKPLLQLAELSQLQDGEMVKQLRAAMLDPNAPTPSIEAILHAILPFRFVDHSHANAISALTCSKDAEVRIKEVYGKRVIVVPYVMPGFILSKTVADLIKGRDLRAEGIEGLVLLKHGLFTFADDAKSSYEKHIQLVTEAEQYLAKKAGSFKLATAEANEDLLNLAEIRKQVSSLRGKPILAKLDQSPEAVGYSLLKGVENFGTRGPLTPDHSIRTKRTPVYIEDDISGALEKYSTEYKDYFKKHQKGESILDTAPRYVIWKGKGIVSFGETEEELKIISDIAYHTAMTIQLAEACGGWDPLPEAEIFAVEYWELEQAKLKKAGQTKMHQGKVALVSGSAAGIGYACAESMAENGAKVIGLDLSPEIVEGMAKLKGIGRVVNLTDDTKVQEEIAKIVREFGGIDIVVSNAGIFTAGQNIEDLESSNWDKAMAVNVTSHQKLLKLTIPYLKRGMESSIILVGSRNYKAPGPGAASYSCSKAALTQLGRVAALELASHKIRCNIIHPDAVFDTKLWTPEALQRSAERYGMTVEEYKTKNLMKVEIKSKDIGNMVAAMAGPLFAKTTGAQIPVDGGNDRVL